MKKSLYIDIHAIQTLPPSCVNRDDTGAPKTVIYGDVKRARVSSQAWKRAMREHFKTNFIKEEIGIRTQQLPSMIASEIMELDSSFSHEKAMEASMGILKTLGIKVKDGSNAALFFVSEAQVRALAKLKVEGETQIDAYERALIDNPTLDIALFGRMVAGATSLNYDAAVQVTNAISTHEVKTEYDYFSAVDDYKAEGKSGAAYLGTSALNSSTLYRYATVNVTELAASLGQDTARVVRAFVEAFICSMPTGKQNTFANRTLPDMLYVTMRLDQPVNLSGAFLKAIEGRNIDYAKASCEKLLTYAEEMYANYALPPTLALGIGNAEILSGHAEKMPMNTLLDRVEEYVEISLHEDTI